MRDPWLVDLLHRGDLGRTEHVLICAGSLVVGANPGPGPLLAFDAVVPAEEPPLDLGGIPAGRYPVLFHLGRQRHGLTDLALVEILIRPASMGLAEVLPQLPLGLLPEDLTWHLHDLRGRIIGNHDFSVEVAAAGPWPPGGSVMALGSRRAYEAFCAFEEQFSRKPGLPNFYDDFLQPLLDASGPALDWATLDLPGEDADPIILFGMPSEAEGGRACRIRDEQGEVVSVLIDFGLVPAELDPE